MKLPSQILLRPLFIPLLLIILGVLLLDHYYHPKLVESDLLNEKASFRGEILEMPIQKDDYYKFPVRLNQGWKIQLSASGPNPGFKRGDGIKFYTKLKKPSGYLNPGVFDYAKYLERNGIGATGYIDAPKDLVLLNREWGLPRRIQETIRDQIYSQIKKLTKPSQDIIVALLWGDQSQMDPTVKDLYRKLGLSHLLVISGLHFTLIAWLIYQAVLAILRLKPSIFLVPTIHTWISGITLFLTTLYFLFCEDSPSLARSYVAIACYLLARMLKRSGDMVNILFVAASIILLIQREDLFNLSFQLSFLSVASIIWIYPWLRDRLQVSTDYRSVITRLWGGLVQLFVLNLAIFMGLTPFLAATFRLIQWNGLVCNVLMIPFISFLVTPLSFLGLMTSWVSPLAEKIFGITGWLLDLSTQFLENADLLLPPSTDVFAPHPWELAVIFLFFVFLVLEWSPRIQKMGRVLCGLILIGDLFFIFHHVYFSKKIRLTHMDIGQGDSLLLELPGAKRVLIDGGGGRYYDLGKNVLIPFLNYQRIPRLDVVVVTHSDTDHYRGLKAVLQEMEVGELWWNGYPSESWEYGDLIDQAGKRGILVRKLATGSNLSIGQAKVLVLSPDGSFQKKDNNESLVLRVDVDGHSLLLTGDIEAPVEYRLIQQGEKFLDVDYLKIAHHGSKTSSTIGFLKATSPKIATVSAGFQNQHHHPNKKILERIQGMGIPLYRTDLDGAVSLEFTKKGITVDRLSPRITPPISK